MAEVHKGLFYAMETIREMVTNFCNEHSTDWLKLNEEYKKDHGFSRGADYLTMRSFVGTDMLIDFAYLARDVELGGPFTNEYWIRSQGTQCIRNDKDREVNRCFGDIVAKIVVVYDGNEFTDIHWIEDEDCLLKNKFLDEGKLYYNRVNY